MDTVIDLRILDPRFQSGLIFSFFEGLIHGKSIKLIFDRDPQDIKNHFIELNIESAELSIAKRDFSLWEMIISKPNKTCCGCNR